MPKPQDLPDDLSKLSRRTALVLTDLHWRSDVDQLISVMERVLAKEQEKQRGAEERVRLEEEERGELRKSAAARLAFKQIAAEPTHSGRKRLDSLTQQARGRPEPRSPAAMPDEVHLGASAPRSVSPGETFVARFAAYTETNRSEIHRILELESPSSQRRLDLDKCRWHPGTRVTVRLEANDAKVLEPVQTFNWDGNWKIVRFDVEVHEVVVAKNLILKFDVAVEGLPIMALRPEIEVLERNQHRKATVKSSFVEEAAPKSAFASYAGRDRREVLGRVRSLQIFTGIDVFLDCLSLRPGEEWKPKLRDEIDDRDIFWLFWSRSALASEWVDWEWRTALALKSLAGIQPHPLEPLELAPPPKELSDLQFGNMYEWYISQLRASWITCQLRILRHRGASVVHKLSQFAGPKARLRLRVATLLAIVILLGAICAGLFAWIRR